MNKVLAWILLAATLLLGTACAAGQYNTNSHTGSAAALWDEEGIVELIQEVPPAPAANAAKALAAPMLALTCMERKEESLRLLNTFTAAKQLAAASARFKVEDKKSGWRVQEWRKRYLNAASNYAFYCAQTQAENDKVTTVIHFKQGDEARKAALKAVQLATASHKENLHKTTSEAREKKQKAAEEAHENESKKLVQLLAEKQRLKRLHSYPQVTMNLLGFVRDASTGKPVEATSVASKCPFDTYKSTSAKQVQGASNFEMKHGLTGPEGYRCDMQFGKTGYVPLHFAVVLQKMETPAMFRHGVLLPEIKPNPPPYRIVLQYGATPGDLDAHIQLWADGVAQGHDVAEHSGADTALAYGQGASLAQPYVTLDHSSHSGYGPETHTIHKVQPGWYHYYVKNQDYHVTSSAKFEASHATAFFYQGNTLKQSFNIADARNSPTPFWSVFMLQCSGTPVTCSVDKTNKFIDSMPVSKDGQLPVTK